MNAPVALKTQLFGCKQFLQLPLHKKTLASASFSTLCLPESLFHFSQWEQGHEYLHRSYQVGCVCPVLILCPYWSCRTNAAGCVSLFWFACILDVGPTHYATLAHHICIFCTASHSRQFWHVVFVQDFSQLLGTYAPTLFVGEFSINGLNMQSFFSDFGFCLCIFCAIHCVLYHCNGWLSSESKNCWQDCWVSAIWINDKYADTWCFFFRLYLARRTWAHISLLLSAIYLTIWRWVHMKEGKQPLLSMVQSVCVWHRLCYHHLLLFLIICLILYYFWSSVWFSSHTMTSFFWCSFFNISFQVGQATFFTSALG